ncbi:hypothetical protein DFJ74DRAFT_513671 [Hyaloraphidium curvatum]|nr:hypothetical protein DFJ74DRAFT_513671 [Hyaloraphidium curvatum]
MVRMERVARRPLRRGVVAGSRKAGSGLLPRPTTWHSRPRTKLLLRYCCPPTTTMRARRSHRGRRPRLRGRQNLRWWRTTRTTLTLCFQSPISNVSSLRSSPRRHRGSVEDVDLVEVDRDVITSARNRSARPPDEPSRPIELKVFYTVWDSDLPPRALVFQVESVRTTHALSVCRAESQSQRKTLADYSEDIVAAFQLPDRSQVRFLHSRIRVFESTKLDAIADLARKKRSAGELPASSLLDDAKPSSIKLEMMTVGDYEKLLHYQKSQQEKVLAPQTVEISEDEVEEEEEPEQQERDVKLVVRFQEADGRGFEFKMKVSEVGYGCLCPSTRD